MAVFMLLQLAFVLVAGTWLLYRATTKAGGQQLANARLELAAKTRLVKRIESELSVQIAAGYYDPQPLIALLENRKELTS